MDLLLQDLPFDATRNEWYSAASINKYATPGYANYYAGNIADIKGAILLNEILINFSHLTQVFRNHKDFYQGYISTS